MRDTCTSRRRRRITWRAPGARGTMIVFHAARGPSSTVTQLSVWHDIYAEDMLHGTAVVTVAGASSVAQRCATINLYPTASNPLGSIKYPVILTDTAPVVTVSA